MDETKAKQIVHLVEAIRLLAADTEIQFSILPDFVCVPDELAITFCDAYDVLSIYLPQIWGLETSSLCGAISTAFDTMTAEAPEDFFSETAVRHDQRWQDIREQARVILTKLNLPITTPDLCWITYVRG